MSTEAGRTGEGFSLVELMIVLVIIGVATAITAPAVFRTLERAEIRASVKEIMNALRYSRSLAVSRKTETRFYMDIDDQLYWVTTPREERLLRELQKKYENEDRAEEDAGQKERPHVKKKTVNPLIRINRFERGGEEMDTGVAKIIFSPFGNSSGGRIHAAPAGGEEENPLLFEIDVDPVTGRVRQKETHAE